MMLNGLIGFLIEALFVVLVIGVLVWLSDNFLPADDRAKRFVRTVLLAIGALLLLQRAVQFLGIAVL